MIRCYALTLVAFVQSHRIPDRAGFDIVSPAFSSSPGRLVSQYPSGSALSLFEHDLELDDDAGEASVSEAAPAGDATVKEKAEGKTGDGTTAKPGGDASGTTTASNAVGVTTATTTVAHQCVNNNPKKHIGVQEYEENEEEKKGEEKVSPEVCEAHASVRYVISHLECKENLCKNAMLNVDGYTERKLKDGKVQDDEYHDFVDAISAEANFTAEKKEFWMKKFHEVSKTEELTEEEFASLCGEILNDAANLGMDSGFNTLDQNGDGEISKREFKQAQQAEAEKKEQATNAAPAPAPLPAQTSQEQATNAAAETNTQANDAGDHAQKVKNLEDENANLKKQLAELQEANAGSTPPGEANANGGASASAGGTSSSGAAEAHGAGAGADAGAGAGGTTTSKEGAKEGAGANAGAGAGGTTTSKEAAQAPPPQHGPPTAPLPPK
eukprot:TRINITY_DN1466_c0_g1_i1.p1 TRINITY_DN1466_c0_g1~~TRINITY_DN1466_c0_g1_i1.p1  ORF type:complete len:440 (+),score=96.61 TRINITY_DN1466_c0_g1_i1:202-1521(+)